MNCPSTHRTAFQEKPGSSVYLRSSFVHEESNFFPKLPEQAFAAFVETAAGEACAETCEAASKSRVSKCYHRSLSSQEFYGPF